LKNLLTNERYYDIIELQAISQPSYTRQALRAGGRGREETMIIEAYKFKDADTLTKELQNFLELLGVGDELFLTITPNGDLKVIVLDDALLAFRYQDNSGSLPWAIGTPQDVAKEAMSWMGK